MKTNIIINGDALKELEKIPNELVDMCITSPPYFNQRDYGVKGQIGLESTPGEYVSNLCNIFDGVRRVLKKSGTLWVNIGDCYGGYQGKNNGYPDRKNEVAHVPQIKRNSNTAKSLLCVPELFLIEMIRRGWICRNKIIWHKNNVMPSSAKDRFTIDYEMLYFFVKNKKYFFEKQFEPLSRNSDADYRKELRRNKNYNVKPPYSKNTPYMIKANKERRLEYQNNQKGRNKRCVWNVNTKPSKVKHFAMFPEKLIETPLKAGCPKEGIVLDPFFGAGTTGLVALKQGKRFIGIEINPEYIKIANKRLKPHLTQEKII